MEICIISENAYPTSKGGVSEWCHTLITRMKNVQFNVFSISTERKLEYDLPANINELVIEVLRTPSLADHNMDESYAQSLVNELKLAMSGESLDCDAILRLLKKRECKAEEILGSDANWNTALQYYEENFTQKPFVPFYLSWISLYYTLYKTFECLERVPASRIYQSLNAGYAGLLGCLSKLNTESSLIVTEHGLYLKERRFELKNSEIPAWLHGMYESFFEALVRTSYKYSNTVTSVCQDHTQFQRKIEPDLNGLRVIYNGIDTERFNNNKPLEEDNREHFNIGTVTRITPIKDVLTFIRAAKRVLKKHRARFYIVGETQDQEYFEECQRLVKASSLEPYVQFNGFQDSVDWYPKFDVFVLTSLSEGFPLTILEALSCEIPCIATDVGGIPEILEENSLIQKWDCDELARKISWLLENSERRRKIGIRGRKLVKRRFSLSNMVQEYKELYKAMI